MKNKSKSKNRFQSIFYFPKIGVSVGEKNCVRKIRYNLSLGTINKYVKVNNLGINTNTINRKVNNSDISTDTTNRRSNNLNIAIDIVDKKADYPSIGSDAANKEADNLNISTIYTNVNGEVNNSSRGMSIANTNKKIDSPNISKINISKNKKINKQAVANNKACTSLVFLHKVLFILIFFSKLEIVSTFLFSFLLFLVILIKWGALFSKYLVLFKPYQQ